MTPADLKPGHLYRFIQNVENPLCDKRSADYFKKVPVFVKGTLLVCFAPYDTPRLRTLHTMGTPFRSGFTAAIHREDGVGLSKHARDKKWTEAIVPHLEEVAIDSWDLMRRAYSSYAEPAVLRELIEDGTLPLERAFELLRKHTPGTSAE